MFGATWLAYAAYYFCRKPFFVAKSVLHESYGWDAETLGLLGSSYLVAYTLGQFAAGALGTSRGPRVLLLGGMALTVLANAALGFVDNAWTFGVLLAVNGLAQATGWAGGVGTMAAWFSRGQRGTVMGFWATNFQVGGVVATAFAAWLLHAYGLRGAFVWSSWATVIAWGAVLLWQRDKPEDVGLPAIVDEAVGEGGDGAVGGAVGGAVDETAVERDGADRWTARLVINIGLIGCFYFFVKFIRYAVWSWAPFLLSTEYALEIDDAGYLSTAFDAAGIVGVIAAGVASDRWFRGRRAGVSFGFIVAMALSCGLLATLGRADLTWFGISLALIGFSLYGPDALMSGAGAMDVGSRRQAVAAAGIINGMGSCGSVVQDLVLGSVLQRAGSGAVFAILLGSAVGALACLGLLLARNRAGAADL